jgi:antagonist of KipI
MSIVVKRTGLLATLQDEGRTGFQSQGVPTSGAMDGDAFYHANLLVGNRANAACIEMAMHGNEFQFESRHLVAIAGGGSSAFCDNQTIIFNRPFVVDAGAIIKFQSDDSGVWSYLAVAGGFDIKHVLGSGSTYLLAGFGGLNGCALKAGDRLPVLKSNQTRVITELVSDNHNVKTFNWGIPTILNRNPIRVYKGNEWSTLADKIQRQFLTQNFIVSADSNRMGYRLSGSKLKTKASVELISTAVMRGTIQLPHDGLPIVLMADAQTVGGYPRIAHVAAVDLPRLAQKRPGDHVRFSMISYEEALELFLANARERIQLQAGIRFKFKV